MKFLTRENAGPLAADEHHRQAFKRYREHLETQRSKMSDPIQKLAFELNFHDARLKRVEKVGRTIEVAGVLGDLQVGYQTFLIQYQEADSAVSEVLKAQIALPKSEVLHDELSWTGDRWVHAYLLWPEGELSISFSNVEVALQPATDETRYLPRPTGINGF